MADDDSPQGWYTDTTGRHERRLWDGARWTDQVMDAGGQRTDSRPDTAIPTGADRTDRVGAGRTSPPPRWRLNYGQVAGAALANAWIAPLVAAFVTAAVFFGWRPFSLPIPSVGAGVVAGLLVWLLAAVALAPIVATPTAQSSSWDEASMRLDELRRRLADLRQGGATGACGIDQAQADVDCVDDDFLRPGVRWATHMGYIALWGHIHRAEEALILSLDPADLWQVLQKVLLQLDGAQAVSARLVIVIKDVARFLAQNPPAGAGAGAAPPVDDLGLPPVASLPDAQGRLREVAAAVNSFRDQQFAGLVRLRNRTLGALCLTEVSAYVLLTLAVAYGVGRAIVATAILFYVVAAVVGFLARLMALSSSNDAVEDYGLNFARLLIVPVVAGLAGLGGVLLTGMLFNTSFSSLITASAARVSPPALPHPADIFNLGVNPAGLLVAVVFGYAPELLQARLDMLVDSYKTAITSTEPAQGGSSASG